MAIAYRENVQSRARFQSSELPNRPLRFERASGALAQAVELRERAAQRFSPEIKAEPSGRPPGVPARVHTIRALQIEATDTVERFHDRDET
ncbi:hypothetical protein Aple_094510 [Acrocarpospora pleiomorpha]|uniref:Uncharacterized protein n=1 Tax=Acrocarpospora pleiomorpha TaxID=90975 RepID=A0A5M3XZR0_9ACTN|nr:hypothetical protein Aple_094510 [Acrocarpospora pleiomorpha]